MANDDWKKKYGEKNVEKDKKNNDACKKQLEKEIKQKEQKTNK